MADRLTAADIAALRELEDRSAREGLSQWTLDNRHWLKKRHWEFIAALRNAAPRLLAEVERLTAENAELRERALLWERLHDGRTESLNRQYRLIKYAIEAPDAACLIGVGKSLTGELVSLRPVTTKGGRER